MKIFNYGIDRLKGRIPIWKQQFQTILRNEGLLALFRKAARKIYRYLRFSGDPHRIHKAQYNEWIKNIEAHYTNPEYVAKLLKKCGQDIKFSIIFPVWNKEVALLQKALDSVVNQHYQNFEICISDGSTELVEETAQFLSDYQKAHKSK